MSINQNQTTEAHDQSDSQRNQDLTIEGTRNQVVDQTARAIDCEMIQTNHKQIDDSIIYESSCEDCMIPMRDRVTRRRY
jgi:hypothetical protein